MVSKRILTELKQQFERGAAFAEISDIQLVFEFFKEIALENDEINEILEKSYLEIGFEVIDKDKWFWLKSKGNNIEYGEGKPINPTFIFRTTMAQAAGVIFGDIDPTSAYMAGEIEIQGNLQDALSFNDVIIVAIEAFEDLIKDL